MHQHLYSRFLGLLEDRLHFAAHSHHPWPDVSREAQLRYWDDSARWIDDKWDHVFSEVIPQAQKRIAQLLHLKKPSQIAFAPNTHELVNRLFSTFEWNRTIRILTSSNEFHSFSRQLRRMEEEGRTRTTRVNANELSKDRTAFLENLRKELETGDYDLFFISQVFFDSGIAITDAEILKLVQSAPTHTRICIDGYHAFAAIPVNLSALEDRIFYVAGGYKYAQGGEGVCFLVVPEGKWRPSDTGWFAEIGALSGPASSQINYSEGGAAFLGSTQDPSGLYRFNAVWDLFEKESITIEKIHDHVVKLQDLFLGKLAETEFKNLPLVNSDRERRGHFLTFDCGSPEACSSFHMKLKSKGILTDYRGQRLRVGFGIYQTEEDVFALIRRTILP